MKLEIDQINIKVNTNLSFIRNLNWPRWKRVLLTRTIAIAPTLVVTLTSTVDKLTGMNDYLNALMVIQLPFAILPTLTFSSSKLVMGKFSNNTFNMVTATLLSVIVIFINIYFVVQTVIGIESSFQWLIYSIAAFYGVLYIVFVLYLVSKLVSHKKIFVTYFPFLLFQVGCYLSVLNFKCLESIPKIGKYFSEVPELEYKYTD